MTEPKRPSYDPTIFAPAPARDARFDVKEQWVDMYNLPEEHVEREVEFFHRQMNEEINGMECAARTLADFPEADWELRMCIARQCYDEARHVEMFRRIFEQRGGRIGQYPVLNFQYRIITKVDDLLSRLAVQNRTFETAGIDAIQIGILDASTRGDERQAELYDAQLADEICHVRFANEYISKVVSRDPAGVMRIARAVHYSCVAFLQVMGQEAIDAANYPVNEKGRLQASFSADEVQLAVSYRAERQTRSNKA
jgi:uncharacterized ferritin-like protein (DUF455 family)